MLLRALAETEQALAGAEKAAGERQDYTEAKRLLALGAAVRASVEAGGGAARLA